MHMARKRRLGHPSTPDSYATNHSGARNRGHNRKQKRAKIRTYTEASVRESQHKCFKLLFWSGFWRIVKRQISK